MKQQYGYGQYPVESESHKGTYILLVVVMIIFIIIFLNFFSKMGSSPNEEKQVENKTKDMKAICGDGICDINEGCFSCSIDCVCISDKFCNIKSDRCEKPLFDVESIIRRGYGDTNYLLLSQFKIDDKNVVHAIIGNKPFIIWENGEVEPYPDI